MPEFPKPSADHVEVDGSWYFKSYYEAKEYLKEHRDGFPQMRVVDKQRGWAVEAYQDGPLLGPHYSGEK